MPSLRRGIYALFVALGILSVLISLYVSSLTGGILHFEGPSQLYFALLICSILTTIGLYAYKRSFLLTLIGFAISIVILLIFIVLFSLHPLALFLFPLLLVLIAAITIFRDHPYSLPLRIVSITFAVALVSFVVFLSWGAYMHYHSKIIYVEKIQSPESYIDLTDELDEYPSIKRAITYANPKTSIKVNLDEFSKIEEIGTNYTKTGDNYFYIKVGDNYYKIFSIKAVGVRKLDYVPENYSKISKADLKLYPSLKEIMSKAEEYKRLRNTSVYIPIPSQKFYEIRDFVKSRGNVIEFNGDYYEIRIECSIYLEKIEYPSKCVKVSEEKLSEYPTLKRAIDLASKNEKAVLNAPPEEWSKTMKFIREIGGSIDVNGSCYTVRFMTV